MKKILIVCLMFCGSLYAQDESPSSRFSLKLQSRLSASFEIGNSLNLTGIYPAVQIKNARGQIHQLEISGISLGKFALQNTSARNYYFAAGYEFSIPLSLFGNDEFISPYLGLGLSSTYSSSSFNSPNTNQFIQRGASFLTNIYLVPSIQRSVTEKLFFDFALLVHIGDFTITNSNNQNPRTSSGQQNITRVDREFFNFQEFGFRVGFGVRL